MVANYSAESYEVQSMNHLLKNAVECSECGFLSDCGGLFEKASMLGCFSECAINCDPATCDLTCPHNHELFADRLKEIEGRFEFSSPILNVANTDLPQYVTKIHNGSSRSKLIDLPVVVIPVREILHKSGSEVSCRFKTAGQLRKYFRLSSRSAYIISCISVDEHVEMVWWGLKYGGLAEQLSKLTPAAIIVPNFSFFIDDVPRTHTIYNRKRVALASRILSEAGCRVILPLNALTQHDWDFWHKLLQENHDMLYVAKEFQTGLKVSEAATRAIENLVKLQSRLNRPIHPIVFGGSKYKNALLSHFRNYTIVDSRPFMMAAKRRKAIETDIGSYSEVHSPTAKGETIDKLLKANIEMRLKYLG